MLKTGWLPITPACQLADAMPLMMATGSISSQNVFLPGDHFSESRTGAPCFLIFFLACSIFPLLKCQIGSLFAFRIWVCQPGTFHLQTDWLINCLLVENNLDNVTGISSYKEAFKAFIIIWTFKTNWLNIYLIGNVGRTLFSHSDGQCATWGKFDRLLNSFTWEMFKGFCHVRPSQPSQWV